jgi:integrase
MAGMRDGGQASQYAVECRTSQPGQRIGDRSVARRRYQHPKAKFIDGKYRARWREDVVLADGTAKRINRKAVLGTKQDFKTLREAQRKLDLIVAPINALDYRPTYQITFGEFVSSWEEKVKPIAYKEGGSQVTTARIVQKKLKPAFGGMEMRYITTEILQGYAADGQKRGWSAKYVRNILSTMSAMWDVAMGWKYVTHNPFTGLILPICDRSDAEPYSYQEVIRIIETANEPFQTFLRILAESGMRPAEVCALDAKYVHLEDCVISVRQSESLGFIVRPKTDTAYRDFAISEQLTEHLRKFIGERRDGLLFTSGTGRPWRESKVVEKRLNPVLRKLGIKQRGLKGFRHFNATIMDSKNIPVKTRQTRLGHDDPRMTLGMRNKTGYTHMIGEDDRRVAAMFGDMFHEVLCPDASEDANASPYQMSLAF